MPTVKSVAISERVDTDMPDIAFSNDGQTLVIKRTALPTLATSTQAVETANIQIAQASAPRTQLGVDTAPELQLAQTTGLQISPVQFAAPAQLNMPTVQVAQTTVALEAPQGSTEAAQLQQAVSNISVALPQVAQTMPTVKSVAISERSDVDMPDIAYSNDGQTMVIKRTALPTLATSTQAVEAADIKISQTSTPRSQLGVIAQPQMQLAQAQAATGLQIAPAAVMADRAVLSAPQFDMPTVQIAQQAIAIEAPQGTTEAQQLQQAVSNISVALPQVAQSMPTVKSVAISERVDTDMPDIAFSNDGQTLVIKRTALPTLATSTQAVETANIQIAQASAPRTQLGVDTAPELQLAQTTGLQISPVQFAAPAQLNMPTVQVAQTTVALEAPQGSTEAAQLQQAVSNISVALPQVAQTMPTVKSVAISERSDVDMPDIAYSNDGQTMVIKRTALPTLAGLPQQAIQKQLTSRFLKPAHRARNWVWLPNRKCNWRKLKRRQDCKSPRRL